VGTWDVIVIGTGSAASAVASRCRAAGWSVAVVDARPFGGTCALRGCDPKKILVGAAEVIDRARRLQGKGVRAEGLHLDWGELQRWKRTFTDPIPAARERGFAEAGVAAFHGRARFVDRTTIRIGEQVLAGRHVVIASGAKPAPLGFPGHEHLVQSDGFLELEALPRRVLFVGGGYVSFELAHVAARAGAQVTIVHRGARPLRGFDPDLVDRLVQHTRELGIDVVSEAPVGGVARAGSAWSVTVETAAGRRDLAADLVVHGAGRVPDIDELALEAAGVAYEARGITVNEHMQSVSNPAVYAAGDAAASGLPLTPVAAHEGRVVAANLLAGNHEKVDHLGIPTMVFTLPGLASVGLHEAAARAQGLAVAIKHEDTSGWYTNRREGPGPAAFKVITDRASGKLLGAHVLGPHAEEVINLFALALRLGLDTAALRRVIFTYPTASSDIGYML
jgi:glutathione reductase (NADPH)